MVFTLCFIHIEHTQSEFLKVFFFFYKDEENKDVHSSSRLQADASELS